MLTGKYISIEELQKHWINDAGRHIEETDPRPEFVMMEKYCRGLGFDLGPGTNRLSPTVLCSDWYPHKGVDMVWNCAPDITEDGKRYFVPFPFSNDTFDFIFASHVLEDFHPDIIQYVFDELLRMIKPGGYLITLGPDMQNSRYPKWDEIFTEAHEDVKSGKRQVGEKIGNPSHLYDWGLDFCHKLKENSKYSTEIVCEDTVPHTTMTLDFVLRKI